MMPTQEQAFDMARTIVGAYLGRRRASDIMVGLTYSLRKDLEGVDLEYSRDGQDRRVAVGVRARNADAFRVWEFTLRHTTQKGWPSTDWEAVWDGRLDWYVYEVWDDAKLVGYYLIDMEMFRELVDPADGRRFTNPDGSIGVAFGFDQIRYALSEYRGRGN